MEHTLKNLAEYYLGSRIEPSEWAEAKAKAEKKLENIISRVGDAGGKRREPFYLAQLIAEAVVAIQFTSFSNDVLDILSDTGEKEGRSA